MAKALRGHPLLIGGTPSAGKAIDCLVGMGERLRSNIEDYHDVEGAHRFAIGQLAYVIGADIQAIGRRIIAGDKTAEALARTIAAAADLAPYLDALEHAR